MRKSGESIIRNPARNTEIGCFFGNQKKHQKMDYKELQQIDCWEIDNLINQSSELCIYKGKI